MSLVRIFYYQNFYLALVMNLNGTVDLIVSTIVMAIQNEQS